MKTYEFDSIEKWLDARRSIGIGSTDAPAIVGVSRYKSAFQLFHEKRKTLTEELTPQYVEMAKWGRRLEDLIGQRYAVVTKRDVERTGEGKFVLQQHDDVEWMIASCDRYAIVREVPVEAAGEDDEEEGDEDAPTGVVRSELAPVGVRIVVELKNAHFMTRNDWDPGNNEPPIDYVVQLQHQLGVTGMPWGSIAALVGGVEFRWADVKRNDDFIRVLMEKEAEFIDRVQRNDPPEADGSAATGRILKALYPTDNGDVIELPPEAIDIDVELEKAKAEEKDAKGRKKDASNRLKALMGAASIGTMRNGVSYTFKKQSRREVIQKATEFRVLRRAGGKA